MKTFLFTLWQSGKVMSVKAYNFNHAESIVRRIYRTNEFTVELQLPTRNYI